MKQAEFLKKLRKQLWWRLPSQEMEAVLADYGEYFENGLAEGKSEEALCDQFGEPRVIAVAVTEERGSRYYATTLVCMALCGGLLLSNILMYDNSLWHRILPRTIAFLLHGALLVLTVLSLWFAGKMTGKTTLVGGRPRWLPWLHLLLLPLLAILFVFLWSPELWTSLPISAVRLGPMAMVYILLTALLTTVLWLGDVVCSGSGSRWRLALIPVNATVLALLMEYRIILTTMSDPDVLHSLMMRGTCLALVQLLPLLLIPFFCGRREN